MLARYYTSGSGRFLQVDPGYDYSMADPMSWNLYGYTRQHPIVSWDPTGTADVYIFTYYPNRPKYNQKCTPELESELKSIITRIRSEATEAGVTVEESDFNGATLEDVREFFFDNEARYALFFVHGTSQFAYPGSKGEFAYLEFSDGLLRIQAGINPNGNFNFDDLGLKDGWARINHPLTQVLVIACFQDQSFLNRMFTAKVTLWGIKPKAKNSLEIAFSEITRQLTSGYHPFEVKVRSTFVGSGGNMTHNGAVGTHENEWSLIREGARQGNLL